MARSGIVYMMKYHALPEYRIWRNEECGFDGISISSSLDYLWSTSEGGRLLITKRGTLSLGWIDMARHQTEHVANTGRCVYVFMDGIVIKNGETDVQMTVEQYLEEINRIYREMLNFCRDG